MNTTRGLSSYMIWTVVLDASIVSASNASSKSSMTTEMTMITTILWVGTNIILRPTKNDNYMARWMSVGTISTTGCILNFTIHALH